MGRKYAGLGGWWCLWLLGCSVAVLPPLVYPDADGDGHAANVDCDDADPAVHLDAEDLCNGVDDDCDGILDDEAALYVDADGDGWGDAVRLACPGSAGTTAIDGDCDDGAVSVHPGAPEACAGGVDENCDGLHCFSGVHTESEAAALAVDGVVALLWVGGGQLRAAGPDTAGSPTLWVGQGGSDPAVTATPLAGSPAALLWPEGADPDLTVVGLPELDSTMLLGAGLNLTNIAPGLGSSLVDTGDGAVYVGAGGDGRVYRMGLDGALAELASGGFGGHLATADLDGDGVSELATTAGSGVVLLDLEGVVRVELSADATLGLVGGDVDGDGLGDLVSSGAGGGAVWPGARAFSASWTSVATFTGAWVPSLGDTDGDGRADLLLAGDRSYLWFAENLNGVLDPTGADGSWPGSPLVLGDSDGDGYADLSAGRDGGLLLWIGGAG